MLKKKRLLSFLMAFVMVFVSFSGLAFAANPDYDFDPTSGTIKKYLGTATDVAVPDNIDGVPVSIIAQGAFIKKNLTSVKLPESVKRIEKMAFSANPNLSKIELNEGLEYIGQLAFVNDKALVGEVEIPSTVNEIMTSSFKGTGVSSLFVKGDASSSKVLVHSGISPVFESIRTESPYKKIDVHFNSFADPANINLGSVKKSFSSAGDLSSWLVTNIKIGIGGSYVNLDDFTGENDIYKALGLDWDTSGFVKGSKYQVVGKLKDYTEEEQKSLLPAIPGFTPPNVDFGKNPLRIYLDIDGSGGIADEEWGTGDFTYGSMSYKGNMAVPVEKFAITGLSPAGEEKLANNPNVVIPKYVNYNGEEKAVEAIGKSAFVGKQINSVTFPETKGEYDFVIGENSFRSCGITEVTIPEGVKTISPFAFYDNKLTSLYIPSTVLQIFSDAFAKNNISDLVISDLVEKIQIDGGAFAENQLSEVIAPYSIFKIQANVFMNNPVKVKVYSRNPAHFGTGTYIVLDSAFHEFIVVGGEVKREGLYNSLVTANHINTLDIDSNLADYLKNEIDLASQVLGNTEASQEEVDQAKERLDAAIAKLSESGVDKNPLRNLIEKANSYKPSLYTPESYKNLVDAIERAKLMLGKNISQEEVQAEVTALQKAIDALTVTEAALYTAEDFNYGKNSITGFSESGLKKYEYNKDVILPDFTPEGEPIEIIEKDAFHQKEGIEWGTDVVASPLGMKSVILPKFLKRIEESAFRLNNLGHVVFPSGLEFIGESAFNGNQITSLELPDTVTELGDGAFSLNQISNLILSKNLTEIANGLFSRNLPLKKIDLHEGITRIGQAAFMGAPLKELNIPSTVKEIGPLAFSSHRLPIVNIPGTVEIVGKQAFKQNKKFRTLKEVILGEGIKEIGSGAFLDAIIIESHLPSSLEKLGNDAFKGNFNSNKEIVVVKLTTNNKDHLAFNNTDSLKNQEVIYEELPVMPSDPVDDENPVVIDDSTSSEPVKEESIDFSRLAGDDRVETAVEISSKYFTGAKTAVLANGWIEADALVASTLADKEKAPILLTKAEETPEATLNELARLGVKKLILVGGEKAISSDQMNKLEAKGFETLRISGPTRYETALEVAKIMQAEGNISGYYLVDGTNFPDALSLASLATRTGNPILLTRPDKLPEKVKSFLDENKDFAVTIVGGPNSVSKAIETGLPNFKERIAGLDRYETSLEIAKRAIGFGKRVMIANGQVAIDSLTAGALTNRTGSVLLLTPPDEVREDQAKFILDKNVNEVIFIGGEKTISPELERAWIERLK